MRLATSFANRGLDNVKEALAGRNLVIYSVARPASPDWPVQRSGVLATFAFSTPAFDGGDTNGIPVPQFEDNPVPALSTGTPGFARALAADGSVVADFSAGPGNTEVKLSEVSLTLNHPATLKELKLCLPQI